MSAPGTRVVGIDIGGTKIRAGLVDPLTGEVAEEIYVPTPDGGGAAVLALCAELARELAPGGAAVGIGLPEFVDPDGVPRSGVSVDWRGLETAAAFADTGAIRIEADVRAAVAILCASDVCQ